VLLEPERLDQMSLLRAGVGQGCQAVCGAAHYLLDRAQAGQQGGEVLVRSGAACQSWILLQQLLRGVVAGQLLLYLKVGQQRLSLLSIGVSWVGGSCTGWSRGTAMQTAICLHSR
jgi:hypothetical protein